MSKLTLAGYFLNGLRLPLEPAWFGCLSLSQLGRAMRNPFPRTDLSRRLATRKIDLNLWHTENRLALVCLTGFLSWLPSLRLAGLRAAKLTAGFKSDTSRRLMMAGDSFRVRALPVCRIYRAGSQSCRMAVQDRRATAKEARCRLLCDCVAVSCAMKCVAAVRPNVPFAVEKSSTLVRSRASVLIFCFRRPQFRRVMRPPICTFWVTQ